MTMQCTAEQFHHYVAPPIDNWIGLHPLSAIRNKEGTFALAHDTFTEEVLNLIAKLGQGVQGDLRHEPYLAFEAIPMDSPIVAKVYFKEDENGTSHIFSRQPIEWLEDHPVW